MYKPSVFVLVGILLTAVVTVAVWASIADAPWEESATSAAFTEEEVLALTTRAITEQDRFPVGYHQIQCQDADYRANSRLWLVTCHFRRSDNDETGKTVPFTFNDRTGELGD
jgi:hypothetical protein